jgi:protease IV
MKRFLVYVLAAIGGAVILGFFFLVVGLGLLFSGSGTDRSLPRSFVLEMDLSGGVQVAPVDDPFLLAFDLGRPTLHDLVAALDQAAVDPRVRGLHVRGGSSVGGWASTQEFRDAIVAFRASGKPAYLFAETFGELQPAQGAYFFASAFDRIYLQPSGSVGLTGLSVEGVFLGDLLERWRVEPYFEARGEYKDAASIFTETAFSPASREALEAILQTFEDVLIEGIAGGRGLAPDSVRTLITGGPWDARSALAAGLIDGLAYRDEARLHLDRALEPDREDLDANPLRSVSMRRYRESAGTPWGAGPQVALVYGTGAIQRGSSGFDPLGGGGGMGADDVARALRSAVSDARTRAILFRVDSPGGSYVASDVIRREVVRARARGIPVVVSMGDAAASGGYMIAADADRIVAQPATITGSIGVIAGRFGFGGLLDTLGVTVDHVDLGNTQRFYSDSRGIDPADRARLAEDVDRIYAEFVDLVAEGRGLPRDEVEAVARGRVWSGRDALALGLVDELGGLQVALGEVRSLLGLEADAPVQLRRFPEERSVFEAFVELFDPGEGASVGGRFRTVVRGGLRVLALLGSDGWSGVEARMVPLDLRAP